MQTTNNENKNNKILKYYVMPSTIAANIGVGILIGYVLDKRGIQRGFLYGAIIGFVLAMADLIIWSILIFREIKK